MLCWTVRAARFRHRPLNLFFASFMRLSKMIHLQNASFYFGDFMKNRRSPCPVASMLDLFGDKWTMLLIRDLFAGKSHYKEFSESPEKIATNILADRLKKLEAEHIVEKFPSPVYPGKSGYRLTDKGQSLFPVLDAMATWGLEHIPGTQARIRVGKPSASNSR